mgnify:CR=1 FL=1
MNLKKRIAFISVIVFLLVSLLLCIFVWFALKEAKVNFFYATTLNEDAIVEKLNYDNAIPYGVSSLFISKEKVAVDIEKSVPYLKVHNVEVQFPNILQINCEERVPMFYILRDEQGLVLDNEFKVINILTHDELVSKNLTKLDIDANFIVESSLEVGQFASFTYKDDCISLISCILNYLNQAQFTYQFLDVSISQGYDKSGSKVAKVHFHTASSKIIEFEHPTIKTDERVQKLIQLATHDSADLKNNIVLEY